MRARCGSARPAFAPTPRRRCASTRSRPRCCTSSASAALHAGELCLVDAGCELDGYASDITRTFPADGRFRGPQRTLYELVHAAQAAAIAATKPGARQRDAHHAAVHVIAQGLLDLG